MTYYDSIASGYDELHEEEQLKKLKLIRREIQTDDKLEMFRKPQNVLDVGCGTGISTRFFDVKDRQGIDPSKELIRIAIKKDSSGKYLVMKAEDIQYENKFDMIISLTAIQNFENIEKGLENIKKSGRLYILTFLKKTEKRELIKKIIKEKFSIIKQIEEDKDIIYFCE